MKQKRNKKWIGAAIGLASTVAGLISNRINANNQEELERKRIEEEKRLKAEQNALQTAQNLSAQYANTSYIDEFKNKITLKAGGAVTNDRIKQLKQFKCGGRKKR